MIRVRRAGLAGVTDLGRPGLARQGIPAGGAADQYSAAVANILVGNAENAPLIEVTASDFAFTTDQAAFLAVTGAPVTVTAGGSVRRTWDPLCVGADEPVELTGLSGGLRAYVAVNGDWRVDRTLGSCAAAPELGVRTWLRAGATIDVRDGYRPDRHPVFVLGAHRPRFPDPLAIDITAGPDADESVAAALTTATYVVKSESDDVGVRLDGPAPSGVARTDLLSKGVPAGAVELPPGDELLVLRRSHPITAGYAVIAVVTRAGLSTLGQARPGHRLRFRLRTLEEAVADRRRQRQALDDLTRRAHTAFTSVGVPVRAARRTS
ncbi:biotin-dependent carboxyltransferase family protein [Amycolatopsis sp. NPDC059027]|uniref:5-oxoprolinase subunit C family protein n=1 Tax=unclassified Amycolatopsis TaxID=2618356 RepID=UPI00366F8CBA